MADEPTPEQPISIRAFARLLGLGSDNSVRKKVTSGHLVRCVVPGGILPSVGIEEWNAGHRSPTAAQAAAVDRRRRERRQVARRDRAAASGGLRARLRSRGHSGAQTPGTPAGGLRRGAEGRSAVDCGPVPLDGLQGEDGRHLRQGRRVPGVRPRRPGAVSHRAAAVGEDGDDARPLAQILRSTALANEKLRWREVQTVEGALIPKEAVLSAVETLGRTFRDSMLLFVDKHGPAVAEQLGVDKQRCHVVLEAILREHFATTMEKIATDTVIVFDDGSDEEDEKALPALEGDDDE